MKVRCACHRWHDVTPTGLALVIDAFVDGDLFTTKLEVLCYLKAFTRERVARFESMYPGSARPFIIATETPEGISVT